MKRVTALIAIGLWLVASHVQAQVPYSQSRSFSHYGQPGAIGAVGQPTFSPYLNLLRRGGSTLSNYYGLVRPELQFRAVHQQFQSNFDRFQRQFSDVERSIYAPQLPTTGHRVQFMSHLAPGGSIGGFRRGTPTGRQPGAIPQPVAPSGHSIWFGNQGSWFSSNPALPRR